VWTGETAHTADGLLVPPVRAEERMAQTEVEFLRAALAGGERPATEVLTEATTLGIAEMTLRRARKALGVQVRREGFGKDGRFLLALASNGSDAAEAARQPHGNGNGNGFDHAAQLAVPSGFPVS